VPKDLKKPQHAASFQKKTSKTDVERYQKLISCGADLSQFASITKLKNFCAVQGKSRSYLRDFGLNRHSIKKISRCTTRLCGFYRG